MTRSIILTAVCALAIPFAAQAAQAAQATQPAPAPVAEHQKGGEHKGMKHDGEGCECCKKMAKMDHGKHDMKAGADAHAGHDMPSAKAAPADAHQNH